MECCGELIKNFSIFAGFYLNMLGVNSNIYANQFEMVFAEHYGSVKGFAFALLRSEDDAEDIAQNVFIKLWENPLLWRDKSREDLGRYLFAMTKNITLNYIRHNKIVEGYCDRTIDRSVLERIFIEDKALDPIYYEEAELLVRLVLSRLPERRRRIFEMSRFENKSNKEIAGELGISVRTVETQIYRTLVEMKKVIYLVIFFVSL